MKAMKDKSMKGKAGAPKGDFFPSEAKHMDLKRPGEMKGFNYPDTEEAIYSCQQDMVKKVSGNMPKPEYRH